MHSGDRQTGGRAFYINLDRVPERRDFMEAQFARAGLVGAQRFSATDARQSNALDGNGYVAGVGSRWGLTISEIACFESHRAIWKLMVDQGLPAAAIFEDDAELSVHAGTIVQELLNHATSFDLVKLDYSPRVLRFEAETKIGSVTVRPLLEMAPSAAAYILSLEGCRKLLDWSESYSDHLDDFLTLPRPDWRMFQCFPACGVQMMWARNQGTADHLVKTSERTQDKSINSGLDKGPVWFRLRRELQAVSRKLKWRLGGQSRLLRQGGFVGLIPCAEDLNA